MAIQEQIRADLTDAMKNRKETTKSILRVVLAEFSREPTKTTTDERAVKIIKKLIDNEESLRAPNKNYINTLQNYLPQEATDEEIRKWISDNIDLTKFKNKMQAMKPIMAEFAGRVDGNRVKSLLNSI